jgi:hypothetical protein
MDETVAIAFRLINAFVLPFWALMILAPHWSLSVRIIRGWWYLAVPAAVYGVFLVYAMTRPDASGTAEALTNPTVDSIHQLLSQRAVTPAAWTHYLAFDLAIGRWMFLRESQRGYWLSPLLLLTLMLGPLGLLGYLMWRQPTDASTIQG